jgi:hypothetical protein
MTTPRAALEQRIAELPDDACATLLAALESVLAPPLWKRRGERDRIIREYCARFLGDCRGTEAKIQQFRQDLHRFESGEFQHLQHHVAIPSHLTGPRRLLWRLLKLGVRIPDARQLHNILRV